MKFPSSDADLSLVSDVTQEKEIFYETGEKRGLKRHLQRILAYFQAPESFFKGEYGIFKLCLPLL